MSLFKFWHKTWLTSVWLGAFALAANASDANSIMQQVTNYTEEPASEVTDTSFDQVTSVSQLTDVKPTDWAFQALQSLVERYGCIVGYPDRTFRGNQALSRYEFAAGLNACMDRISELIAASTADLVKREDLLAVQRLQEEFAAELAAIRGTIDQLEVRTATLERQQFSATTKLTGEVIFNLSVLGGDEGAIGRRVSETNTGANNGDVNIFNPGNSTRTAPPPTLSLSGTNTNSTVRDRGRAEAVIREVYRVRGLPLSDATLNAALNTLAGQTVRAANTTSPRFRPPNPDLPQEAVFADRVRLNFDTSFNGRDRLRTRLEAANFSPYNQGNGGGNTGTNMTRLGFDSDTGNNAVKVDELWYRFPIGELLRIQVDATNAEFQDSVLYTFNPLFQSSGTGAISRFGRFSPIYRLPGDLASGVAFSFNFAEFNNKFTIEGGYYAGGANDPTTGTLSNPALPATKNGLFDGGYAALAQFIFRPTPNWDLGLTYVNSYFPEGTVNIMRSTGSDLSRRPFGNNVATAGNSFGFQTVYRLSPSFTVSGWFGYTIASAKGNLDAIVSTVPGVPGTTRIQVVDNGDNANVIYWGATLGVSDLLKEGSLLGLIVGQQPRVINNDSLYGDENTSNWHIEGLYRFPISDNLDLTPGVLVIVNPENNSNNGTIVVGTIRATFKF